MVVNRSLSRTLGLLVLFCLLAGSTGCTYLKHRAEDLVETFDVGLMVSGKPGLAVYGCGASIACLGFSNVDGWCLGMGGGQVGIIRHKNTCYGRMFYGYEDMVWGRGGSRRHYSHPQGLYSIAAESKLPPPAYFPACVHYVHVLFIGAVANARYAEMIDFILGFTGFDMAYDDGRKMGKWFWQ